jgi:putative SOS response-associated peptidase YedK
MCGRYKLTAYEKWLSDYFNLDPADVDWAARWNVAPTDEVATIGQSRREPKRKFARMRWGLIPSWAKDTSIGANAINAVSETAAEKPMFRDALSKRRCLIPADGFYEWKQITSKKKQPYSIEMTDSGIFAFAGLWEIWKDPAGKVIYSCTILTTEANALLKPLHHRMPVILSPDDYDLWLDPGVTDPAKISDLLRPFDARQMKAHPVSSFVNKAGNDSPECAAEVAVMEDEQQGKLF